MEDISEHQTSFSSIGFGSNELQCIEKNEATLVCANEQCLHRPFVCSSQACKCNFLHEACILVSPHSLVKKIEKKMINPEPLINELNKIVDHCIDWLSEWREKMEDEIKYYGVTQKEKEYLIAIQCNSAEDINGEIVSEVVKSNSSKNDLPTVKQALQSIHEYWEKQEQTFYSIFKDMQDLLCFTPKNYVNHIIKSRVVESNKQLKTLCSFFPQKVTRFKLLYRASENDFSVKKFWEKCVDIPQTLVLVHTDYGKKIGGYIPNQWSVLELNKFHHDYSKRSFIFSLTNEDSFALVQPEKSTQYCSQLYGPRFGGGHCTADLCIKDKANVKYSSYSSFNYSYFNKNYKANEPESYRRFSGGQTQYFKIKEWEIFEVRFDQ